MLLVPSVMNLLGAGNWWMPDWLGRHLPELHIEGHPEAHLPATRPVDAFDGEPDGREPVTAT
jgi:RND superfamily putative drug exporter